jgi:hypothetical protein
LSWDITRCADPKALRTKRRWPYTDVLIWYTMFTDIGWEVTEENAPEFYARIHLMEKLGSPLLSAPARTKSGRLAKRGGRPYLVPCYITPEDVKSVIGLRVNVSPEPRLKWAKKKVIAKPRGFGSTFMDDYATAYKEAVAPIEEV